MPEGKAGGPRPLAEADLRIAMEINDHQAFSRLESRTGGPPVSEAIENRIRPTIENQREGETSLRLEDVKVNRVANSSDDSDVSIRIIVVISKPPGRLRRLKEFDFGSVLEMQEDKIDFIKSEVEKAANTGVDIDRTFIGVQ